MLRASILVEGRAMNNGIVILGLLTACLVNMTCLYGYL
jgi:hypothetical protein